MLQKGSDEGLQNLLVRPNSGITHKTLCKDRLESLKARVLRSVHSEEEPEEREIHISFRDVDNILLTTRKLATVRQKIAVLENTAAKMPQRRQTRFVLEHESVLENEFPPLAAEQVPSSAVMKTLPAKSYPLNDEKFARLFSSLNREKGQVRKIRLLPLEQEEDELRRQCRQKKTVVHYEKFKIPKNVNTEKQANHFYSFTASLTKNERSSPNRSNAGNYTQPLDSEQSISSEVRKVKVPDNEKGRYYSPFVSEERNELLELKNETNREIVAREELDNSAFSFYTPSVFEVGLQQQARTVPSPSSPGSRHLLSNRLKLIDFNDK